MVTKDSLFVSICGQISMTDAQPATGAPAVLSGPPQQTRPSSSERYPETVEALRSIGKLRKTFNKVEARVVALEDGKADKSQLSHLKELVTNKGNFISPDLIVPS